MEFTMIREDQLASLSTASGILATSNLDMLPSTAINTQGNGA
jgi:hypothetical protein